MDWRLKKQLTIIAIVVGIVGATAFFVFYFTQPLPSCIDNIRNQGETEVDCGGPCVPCALRHPKDITVFWSRFVRLNQDTFDVVANIKNPNEFLASSKISYEFELIDAREAAVAVRRGETFLLPGEDIHIVENNLKTSREPVRLNFKITGVEWVFKDINRPDIIVGERTLKKIDEEGIAKTLVLTSVQNRTLSDFRQIEVKVILLDEKENLIGATKIIERNFLSGELRPLEFFWPGDLVNKVKIIRVEPRTNILDKENVIRR